MSQPVHDVLQSFEDYVAFERSSTLKHEFRAGQIYAMEGGTFNHAALAASVSGLLFAQLAKGPCRLYSSDLRVRAGELVTYPDVTVVCGQPSPDARDPSTILNPKLVVEVARGPSEAHGGREKLEHYRRIASLQAVLFVAHGEHQLELWSRGADGWKSHTAISGERVELPAIGASLVVQEVYARAGLE
jgi:Uma2 family endonuclease